jgi:thioredoxin 1
LVLLIFGANWRGDCRALDVALKSSNNAELISREFVLVKIDVGNFNRNLSVAKKYGNPVEKGIPAAVVLSPSNQPLYSTRKGELSNARRISETGVYNFFNDIVSAIKSSN